MGAGNHKIDPNTLERVGAVPARARWVFVLGACVIHALVLSATSHDFIADAPLYAASISRHIESFSCDFFEAGHLLWRPMGFGLTAMVSDEGAGQPLFDDALRSLTLLAVVFGFVTVAALAAWIYSAVGQIRGAAVGVLFVLVSKSFINYSQVGASYVPALALLALGLLLLLVAFESSGRAGLLAGLGGSALALSAFFWGPFLLVVPGSLLSVVVLRWGERKAVIQAAWAALGAGVVGLGVLAWVAVELRLRSLADVAAWAGESSHGIDMVGGMPRAVIGLPRSIVHLGDLGTTVKRVLLQDPSAPMPFTDLFTLDLALFVGFYAVAAWCLWRLFRTVSGRKALVLLLLSAAPLVLFAISWQGGDLERYLPLTPVFALVLALTYAQAGGHRLTRVSVGVFLALILMVNVAVLLKPLVQRAQAVALARLSRGALAESPSLLVVPTHQDDVFQLQSNYPAVLRPYPGTRVVYLILPGTPEVLDWRGSFSNDALRAWREGAVVRFSGRLLAERPDLGWGWTEGEDPRVSWNDLHEFVAQFDVASTEDSGPEGFVSMVQNDSNRTRLDSMATDHGTTLSERVARCSFPPRRAWRALDRTR